MFVLFFINISFIPANWQENVMIFTKSIDLQRLWHSNFKIWTHFFEKIKRIEKPHEFISFWTFDWCFRFCTVPLFSCNYTTMFNSYQIYLHCEIPFLWPLMWQSLCATHKHTHQGRFIIGNLMKISFFIKESTSIWGSCKIYLFSVVIQKTSNFNKRK